VKPVPPPPPAPGTAALARTVAGLALAFIAAPSRFLADFACQAATPAERERAGQAADRLSGQYGIDQGIGRATYYANLLRGLVLGRIVRADLLPFVVAWAESQVAHPVVLDRLRTSRVDFFTPVGAALVPVSQAA
jgi:hypothetical protein